MAQRANWPLGAVGASPMGLFGRAEGGYFSTNNRHKVQKHALFLLKYAKLWRKSGSTSCSL